jgi:hypothetical protein
MDNDPLVSVNVPAVSRLVHQLDEPGPDEARILHFLRQTLWSARDAQADAEEQGEANPSAAATLEALKPGLAAYRRLLHHPGSCAREAAVDLVCACPQDAEFSVELLLDRLQRETDACVRVSIIRGLGRLRPEAPAVLRALEETAVADSSDPVRFQAAAQLVMGQGPDASESVLLLVAQLAAAACERQGCDGLLALAAGLGEDRETALLVHVLPSISDEASSLCVAQRLLELAFPDRRNDLRPQQRRVLAALAAHDPLWRVPTAVWSSLGLPADRQALMQAGGLRAV